MKLWWLPPIVANTLIVCGTVLVLGSLWQMPQEALRYPDTAITGVRLTMAVIGVGLGAGMIVNGIARSTRPPEQPK
jgi:hypothetical protein